MIFAKRISILPLVGLFVTIIGGILSFCWDGIFSYVLAKEFRLTPTSKLFELWKDLPIPVELQVYFFNWTNPQEIFDEGFKPRLVEMGPYVFKEHFEKVNVTWNKNGTLTYKNRRFWYFDPAKSNGSLDDNITTLNPVPVAAAYVSRYNNFLYKMAVSNTIRIYRQQLWITKTAGEFLFSGYPDPLMTLVNRFPFLKRTSLSGDKFSWFINRNGSSESEGTINMETGEDDVSKVGIIREWNYKNRTDFFEGECGMINGSDGILFHSGQKRGKPIDFFSPDHCKSLRFHYLEDTEIDGILGYRYVGTKMLLDNGELDPNNWCNCNGECLPYGVLNISACHFGAPGFVSNPHFLYADPYYLQQVEGLQPNEIKHRMYSVLEPKSGLPMEAVGRAQMNLLLQPHDSISLFNNVPKIVFPMLWVQKSAKLSPKYFTYLRILLAIAEKGIYFSVSLVLLGIVMMIVPAVRSRCSRNSRGNDMQEHKPYDTLQVQRPKNTKATQEEHILLQENK